MIGLVLSVQCSLEYDVLSNVALSLMIDLLGLYHVAQVDGSDV